MTLVGETFWDWCAAELVEVSGGASRRQRAAGSGVWMDLTTASEKFSDSFLCCKLLI